MNKIICTAILLITGYQTNHAQFGKLMNKVKKESKEILSTNNPDLDISGGLKEALELGITEAVDKLSAKNGYYKSPYKILIPEDAQKVIDKVKVIPGFQNVEKDIISKMNEAAEIAAKKATPIFVNAIKSMSFDDAKSILFGADDEGTRYLENSARKDLYKTFLPIIQAALNEVNATKYWKDVVQNYNAIPFMKDLNPDLDDHVNDKALDGLFGLIEVKEDKIRTDINQRSSPLLKDVFGQLE